jgi:hypothetical protein
MRRACSLICGIHNRLKLMGKVPHDAINKLMKVFQTTLVDKFNQLFLTLSYNKDLTLVNTKLLTVGKLVKLAETKYHDLLMSGKWTCDGSPGSAFMVHKPSLTINHHPMLEQLTVERLPDPFMLAAKGNKHHCCPSKARLAGTVGGRITSPPAAQFIVGARAP